MVAMNSHISSLILLLIIYTLVYFSIPYPIYCLNLKHPLADATQDLLVEDKSRMGSTPPSCHNKCNNCHPCMVVQVPTMPGRGRVQPHAGRAMTLEYFDSSPSSTTRYSNYKPLGWKCRCDDHLYNP
ncbi:hypothetical protein LIER_13122 [Lithospermum erythrorhizon]|uniref:Epidermal patterning factor-like protein n=1 Tax=Lithospermum erythrorhizon TaxID=34254 RepID=A0AAV3PVS4_LITER